MTRCIIFFLMSLLLICSCNKNNLAGEEQADDVVQKLVFALGQYEGDPGTKTTYDTVTMNYLWAEGDAVGIFSPEGNQLKFTVKPEDCGKQYANFDGRGFALVSGSRYSSYYPFIADFDLSPSAVPVHYDGQVQTGDNSLAHLGNYSYSVAMGVAPYRSQLDFTFRNVGSPHRYSIPVLPGDFQRLTLSIPKKKYIVKGTLNLQAESEEALKTITPTLISDSLSIDLKEASISSIGFFRCWTMMPPVDLTGDVIHMSLMATDGSEYLAALAGSNCPANYRKVFNAASSVYPALTKVNNEGGNIQIKIIKKDNTVAVTANSIQDWIEAVGNTSEGVVTTFSFSVMANAGAEREGNIIFTETETGLTNTVLVRQEKAGAVIGIGGWDSDNHQGHTQ